MENEPGLKLLKSGQFQDARAYYHEKILSNPHNPDNYLYLGYSFLGLKMPDSAEFYARKGLAVAPENKKLHLLKISALMQEKEFIKAKQEAEKFYEENKNDSLARITLGEVYFNYAGHLYRSGNKKLSAEFFKKVTKLLPEFPNAYSNLGIIYYELGEYDSAMKYISLGLNKFPANPDLLKAEAQVLAKQKKFKELKDVLGVLSTVEPDNPNIRLKLALVYRAMGQMDSAIAIYRGLVKEFPDEKSVYISYAQIYEGIFNYKKAREIYTLYLKKHPGDPEFLKRVAETYEGQKDYENAIKIYRKLGDRESELKIANLLAKLGKKKEALRAYQRIIKKAPFHQEYWIKAAELITDRDSLISFLNQMQKTLPNSPYPCARKGLLLLKTDTSKAMKCLRKAVELGTNNPEVYYNLAKIYFINGEKVKGQLTIRIAFHNLTSNVAGIQKILAGTHDIFELEKHEDEIKLLKSTNEYLERMLRLLQENVDTVHYIEFLKELYARYPTSFLVLESLSSFYLQKGKLNQALLYATRLVNVNPSRAKSHYLRGEILEDMGRFNEAFIEFQKAGAGGLTSIEFAKRFIKLGRKLGKEDVAIENLRRIDSPDIKKFLESIDEE